jgi:hypothetical protein
LLWADLTGAPFRATDGSEDHGIGGFCGLKGFVCERFTVGIDGSL